MSAKIIEFTPLKRKPRRVKCSIYLNDLDTPSPVLGMCSLTEDMEIVLHPTGSY